MYLSFVIPVFANFGDLRIRSYYYSFLTKIFYLLLINNIKGYNTIFNNKRVEDFYSFNIINNRSFLPENKPYSDIAIFSYNILHKLYLIDIQNESIESYLKQFIKKTNNKDINYEVFNWDIYTDIINNISMDNFNYETLFSNYFECFKITCIPRMSLILNFRKINFNLKH